MRILNGLKRMCRDKQENFTALNPAPDDRTINFNSITSLKVVRLADDNSPGNANENDEQPYNFTVRFDPSVLITMIVLLCVFGFIAIFSIIFRRRRATWNVGRTLGRAGADINDNWAAAQGLERTVIESFPVTSYNTVKGLNAQAKCSACAICLADFKDYEMLRLLTKCSHAFHQECIDTWLFRHATCPVCRMILLPGDDSTPTVNDFGVLQLQALPEQVMVVTDIGDSVSNRRDVSIGEATNGAPSYDSTGHSLVWAGKELEQGTQGCIAMGEGLTPGLHRSCNFVGILHSQEPSSSSDPPAFSKPGGSLGDEEHRSKSERWGSISVHPPSFVRSFSERIPSQDRSSRG